jgi:tRNA (uracil-5-)-methyltransferase TRM9
MKSDVGKLEMEKLRKSYEKIADEFSLTRSKPWMEFDLLLQYVKEGDKVLDLGCGNGRLYDSLKKKKVDYTGVDFSKSLLKIAREKYPKVDFVEQDISELDLDDQFDCVVSVAVFNHLPSRELRVRSLRHVFEVLKDDGKFILVAWNLWGRNKLSFHLRAWWRWVTSLGKYGPRDLTIPFGNEKVERYYYAFTPSELRRLLVKTGFEIELEKKGVEGRSNFFFVCTKRMAKAVQDPVSIREVVGAKKLSGTPVTAMSGTGTGTGSGRPEPAYSKIDR